MIPLQTVSAPSHPVLQGKNRYQRVWILSCWQKRATCLRTKRTRATGQSLISPSEVCNPFWQQSLCASGNKVSKVSVKISLQWNRRLEDIFRNRLHEQRIVLACNCGFFFFWPIVNCRTIRTLNSKMKVPVQIQSGTNTLVLECCQHAVETKNVRREGRNSDG